MLHVCSCPQIVAHATLALSPPKFGRKVWPTTVLDKDKDPRLSPQSSSMQELTEAQTENSPDTKPHKKEKPPQKETSRKPHIQETPEDDEWVYFNKGFVPQDNPISLRARAVAAPMSKDNQETCRGQTRSRSYRTTPRNSREFTIDLCASVKIHTHLRKHAHRFQPICEKTHSAYVSGPDFGLLLLLFQSVLPALSSFIPMIAVRNSPKWWVKPSPPTFFA